MNTTPPKTNSSPARRPAFASGWATSSRSSPRMTTTGGRASWRTRKTARQASSRHRSCRSGEREKHSHGEIMLKRQGYRETVPPLLQSPSLFVCLWQASGLYSHGEDQAGAAGQLYLVWQEEEAVQRQVFGKAQRRYIMPSHAYSQSHACALKTPHCRHFSAAQSRHSLHACVHAFYTMFTRV